MFEFALTQLNSLIKPLQELGKDKRDLRDNALRSISHAINETYIYYRGLQTGKDRSGDIEAQLAKYWSAAAIPIRHIDEELAMICELKCEYWINPSNWSEHEIIERGISLDELRKRYRRMLAPHSIAHTRRIEPQLKST